MNDCIADEKIAQTETAIFVYGTLKKGFANHHLLSDAKFLALGVTEESYALYVSSIPYVIPHEKVSPIHGEVYLVEPLALANLDRLEGHPKWYKRKQVSVCLQKNNTLTAKINAWIYFYPEPIGQLQVDGIYR